MLFALKCAAQFGDDSTILIKSNPFFLGLIKNKHNQSAVYSGDIKLYALTNEGEPYVYPGEFISVPSVGYFFHVYINSLSFQITNGRL